jgi:uncharacterized protein involved in type VI secretion and phage assembly
MTKYFGKHRGKVVNNIDPLQLGRLQVTVPDVLGRQTSVWAMPCVPYAGPQVGFYTMPTVGANVWIEFEHGDTEYPIWTGCFWSAGELPSAAGMPHVKIFKTDHARLQIDDSAGTLILEIETESGIVRIQQDSEGIRLSAGDTKLTLNAQGFDFDPPLRRNKS